MLVFSWSSVILSSVKDYLHSFDSNILFAFTAHLIFLPKIYKYGQQCLFLFLCILTASVTLYLLSYLLYLLISETVFIYHMFLISVLYLLISHVFLRAVPEYTACVDNYIKKCSGVINDVSMNAVKSAYMDTQKKCALRKLL